MEVRLNKLISDSGLCSRREADKFIEEGRVTVNGSLPHIGQKVTEADIVMLDDIQVRIGKHTGKQTSSARINIQELELAGQEKKAKKTKPSSTATSEKKATSPAAGSKGLRPGKYVKYNKYAAARHAARNGESTKKETKVTGIDKEMLKEALRPKFGKSLGRSAVAQRLASSPKSAALRKTSKNNPLNKAKRAAARNKPKGEEDNGKKAYRFSDRRPTFRKKRICAKARFVTDGPSGLPGDITCLGRGVPRACTSPSGRPGTGMDEYRGRKIPESPQSGRPCRRYRLCHSLGNELFLRQ